MTIYYCWCTFKWYMTESSFKLIQYDDTDALACEGFDMKLTDLMSLEDRTIVRHHNILKRIRSVLQRKTGKRKFI